MKKRPIVAIDGPSGAGKSTLSKALAAELGYLNIDTGAMYRSVALLSARAGIDPGDGAALEKLCAQTTIAFAHGDAGERILVDGEDVSSAIRTPEVSLLTPQVAACPQVRKALVEQQRRMAAEGGVVLEGRDIGSVVFPHAEAKFFLSASAAERGRRRFEELRAGGEDVDLVETITAVEERDAADQARACSPLIQTEDALSIDSTRLSIDQVLQLMLATVRALEQE
jgi:cytidylate kinase